jgi:hypothetical protein
MALSRSFRVASYETQIWVICALSGIVQPNFSPDGLRVLVVDPYDSCRSYFIKSGSVKPQALEFPGEPVG